VILKLFPCFREMFYVLHCMTTFISSIQTLTN